MPPFDVLQSFGKALVVIAQFGRPVVAVVSGGVVSAGGGGAFAITIVLARGVLPLFHTRILNSVTENSRVLAIALRGAYQSFADFG